MRRLTAIVVAMMLATPPLSAQEQRAYSEADYGKNEISVSYGQITANLTNSVFITLLTLGQGNADKAYSGSASLSYLHYVHPNVGIGAVANYEYSWITADIEANTHHHNYTLMPQVKLYWFNRKHVGMYSRIGLGATFLHGLKMGTQDSSWRPAFQLSGVCLETGGRVRGFLELGIGNMGMILAGAKVNF